MNQRAFVFVRYRSEAEVLAKALEEQIHRVFPKAFVFFRFSKPESIPSSDPILNKIEEALASVLLQSEMEFSAVGGSVDLNGGKQHEQGEATVMEQPS